jgi:hypothetical protein
MALMKKPIMTTTFCGFPDMLVSRLLFLLKMDGSLENAASARSLLARYGVTVLNLGDPMGTSVGEEVVVSEMAQTLRNWTEYVFIEIIKIYKKSCNFLILN